LRPFDLSPNRFSSAKRRAHRKKPDEGDERPLGWQAPMTLIEIRPHKWGWCIFESPAVEPVFLEKDQAIGYAETRARLRTGEIRIVDSTGTVKRLIAFDDANRRL
jgi:hypothetical protein